MSQSTHIDKILRVAEQEEIIKNFMVTQEEIEGYDTALKITHNKNVYVIAADIVGGTENAIDIDDVNGFYIQGILGSDAPLSSEAQVLTVKGGCNNGHLEVIVRGEPGRQNSHLQLGNWFDQNYRWTKNITILAAHKDPNKKVNIVTGWVKPFSVKLGKNCKWLFWQSMFLKIYILTKFIIRFIMRIPKGVKGPNWF